MIEFPQYHQKVQIWEHCGIPLALLNGGFKEGEFMQLKIKPGVFAITLICLPIIGLAQQGQQLDAELDSELDRMYQGQSSQVNSGAQAMPRPSEPTVQPAKSGQQAQPIFIVNQSTPTSTSQAQATPTQEQQLQAPQQMQAQQQQIQKQPTIYVQDTPLVESRADELRRRRQQVETGTENRIAEKLEESRIDDEKRRADALFGNSFQQMNREPQPQPVIIQTTEKKETVREEIQTAIRAQPEDFSESRSYFSGLLGIAEYPDSKRITGDFAAGVAFGTISNDRLAIEGSFLVANYTYEMPYYYWPQSFTSNEVDITQYSLGVGARYFFLDSFVRPSVGGLMQYSFREYQWPTSYVHGGSQNTLASSHAIDLGANAGVEFAFNSGFALGLEYRYLFNIYSRLGPDSVYRYGGMDKIEKYAHSLMAISGRFQF